MLTTLGRVYDALVLRRPWLVLAALLGVFGFFSYQAKHFNLDASADSLLLENDADLRLFREVSARYDTKPFLFVTFTPNQELLEAGTLSHIRNLADELRTLEDVDSVLALTDVPLVKNVEGSLSQLRDNLRTLNSPDVDLDKARRELETSPLYRNLIISADGTTTALVINLKRDASLEELRSARDALVLKRADGVLSAEEIKQLRQIRVRYDAASKTAEIRRHADINHIREILGRYREHGQLYLGGVPMIADDMITFIRNDLAIFGIGVFVFLIVMLGVIFQRVRWVLLPLASCVFSGLLMIGILGYAGWPVTVISSNFISLMLIITMSMNVHLVVRYRQLCADHTDKNQRELVAMTVNKMVQPCLYTTLTTIMAFASLLVSGIKPVIAFGWMMTIGLSVAFLTTFLLFPALLVMLPKTGAPPVRQRFTVTRALAGVTDTHGGKILVLAAALAMISLIGISRLQVENSFINYFSKHTEIYKGMKLIDDKLGGTTPLDVVVKFQTDIVASETPQDTAGELDPELAELEKLYAEEQADGANYWFTPYRINIIKKIHDYLDGLPEVGKVLSLASVIRVAEGLNDNVEFDSLELAVLHKRIPEDIRADMIDPFVSVQEDEARINLRILDSRPDLRRHELLSRIRADLTALGFSRDEVKLTGMLVLYNNMLQSLYQSQISTLGVVMAGIALMLLFLFRSIPLAIIGIIPNILAAALILGVMGLLRIPLDMMTITIAAITIGIAVDNSIHYIYRFREEFANSGDYIATLYYCHANIGRAVAYTAVTIIVGFSILALSNFIPTIYFGILTAFAMFVALLAALTLLPGLILSFKPFG